ncbi:MAG: hypothetical protein AB3N16_09540 [Flavobacteriaceae bacterium]
MTYYRTLLTLVCLFLCGACTPQEKRLPKLKITPSVINDDGIPAQTISLVMDNGQQLFIAQVPHKKDIKEQEMERLGLPPNTVFAFSSRGTGFQQYQYGLLEEETLKVFEVFHEEDGSISQPAMVQKYTLQEGRWEVISLEPTNDWTAYRNQHWNPQKGHYYFSEQFTYEYYHEKAPGYTEKGVFSFFHDPMTGTMLLTQGESFSDEMTQFVLIRPKKDYIVSYTNEHSQTRIDTIPQDDFYGEYPHLFASDLLADFPKYYHPVENSSRTFGKQDPKFCISGYTAKDYKPTYAGNDKTVISLAIYPFDLSNLYLLQKTRAMPEGGLPIHISGWQIPGNLLVVKDHSEINGLDIGFELSCISATEYHLTLTEH